MKQVVLIFFFLLSLVNSSFAQKYYTKNGSISFLSKTSLENIKAENNQVMAVLNIQTGEIQFSLLLKGFHFEKTLMEEHFNEDYMETNKFPKANFKGMLSDVGRLSLTTDGMYTVTVNGELILHGISRKISSSGTITVKEGVVSATSTFGIRLSEFSIDIPNLVRDNIAENVEVKVSAVFDQKL
jgi:hypothetical protein